MLAIRLLFASPGTLFTIKVSPETSRRGGGGNIQFRFRAFIVRGRLYEDTDHCVTRGGIYFDTDLCEWVGCDSCYRWYHFKCKRLPKKVEEFVRHIICQN